MEIVCTIGSLRRKSFNRALFNTVREVAPDGVSIREVSISALPLYNADIETPLPDSVAAFKSGIESADGVIIITPEYNRSVPGVLKNAIDWASRPSKQSSWFQKPVCTMGVTNGSLGTSAAQMHLKGVLAHLGTRQMGQPEFLLGRVQNLLSKDGAYIADEETRERVRTFLESFTMHIQNNTL